jgi:DNA-directed RNA polymerase sigma subunit (sigma70/sigma32)
MTYGAIGKTLNVSRERVRQMVAAGLRERQREEQAAATPVPTWRQT